MKKLKEKVRIAVLISGGGTNLQALIDAEKRGDIPSGEIVLVVSNKKEAYGLVRAEKAGIATALIKGEEDIDRELIELLESHDIHMVVMAGFLRLVGKAFVDRFPNRTINIHPSLIPAFSGEGCFGIRVHEAALNYGVKVTGATVHYVNEIADGGAILFQKAVAIEDEDTPEILQKRVMEQAEWVLLPMATEYVANRILNGERE